MTVRKSVGTVGTLAHEAVSTAVSIARHPIGTTALAAGLVKGAAGAGVDFLRGTISGTSPTPDSDTAPDEAPAVALDDSTDDSTNDSTKETAPETAPVAKAAEKEESEDPRDHIPGPDLAVFEPPRPEDLPEPIVIVADDAAYTNGESGEAFHNEPKATSRDSEHGAAPESLEEVDEYVDEVPPVDEVQPQP